MASPTNNAKRKSNESGLDCGNTKRSSKTNIKSATFKINDTSCPTGTLPVMYSLSDEGEFETELLDFAETVDSVLPQDIKYFRGLLLGSAELHTRKKYLPSVPVNMNEFHQDLTIQINRPLYLNRFPNTNVATTGLDDLYAMAKSLESVDINMTEPKALNTDLTSIAVPWRTGVSHEAIVKVNNSYNPNVVEADDKYANDELFEVNTLYRMVGAKFSENIYIMPSLLVPSYKLFKDESGKSNEWIQGQTLNLLDKFYYRRTLSTATEPRPSLLDVRCICIPIVGENHFSVACVMNLSTTIGNGGRDDPLRCILHLDSVAENPFTPAHVTWNVGETCREILNYLIDDNEFNRHYTATSLPIFRIPCKLFFVSFNCIIL